MQFRYDINGLRAIAVIAVVLFHFNASWLPGGFAGVDVFFVISGFLMTAIIFNGLEKNTFNLFKFYNARANRIIPVLGAMSAVLLVFGWFYLLPTDYRDLGRQVEKASFFTSNILFTKGGGYFDTAEHTKWLLHTWSLSVEWQFYIFFPILLVALKKFFNIEVLKKVVLALFVLSFSYCIYITFKDVKTAYFVLSSRAWEMLLGGIAFLYPYTFKTQALQRGTQFLGLALIILSYFLISKETPWPGYMALIPVLGAYLIVLSNDQNNILINNPIFQHIGKWSYSIYVWHWPIVVFGVYFALNDWWMYGIPLSILLGFLSYRLIESIKFPTYSAWKEIYKVKPFYVFLAIAASGYIIKSNDGMENRISKDLQVVIAEMQNDNPYKCDQPEYHECKIGNQNNLQALVVGDSHADAITTSIADVFDLKQQGIISLSKSACPLITDIQFYDAKHPCAEINKKRFEFLEHPKYATTPVVVVGRYPSYILGENDPERAHTVGSKPLIYFGNQKDQNKEQLLQAFDQNLKKTLCKIAQSRPVYITQPTPELGFSAPKRISKNMFLGDDLPIFISYQDYLARAGKIRDIIQKNADQCGVQVLDPAEILCKDGTCFSEYKGRPIYRDGDHLSEYGNRLLLPMFQNALQPDNQLNP